LQVAFADAVGPRGVRSPAAFRVEADARRARVLVNGTIAGEAVDAAVLVEFDEWSRGHRAWVLEEGSGPLARPVIADERLSAAVVGASMGGGPARGVPALSRDAGLRVDFGPEGEAWFGPGWHGPEGNPARWFRWTGALEATVRVFASHPMPLRLSLRATLANDTLAPLSVAWNGRVLAADVEGGATREWTLPAAWVRRGENHVGIRVGRLYSPAWAGSHDRRMLGAAVDLVDVRPAP
jgi:hypothetical protein